MVHAPVPLRVSVRVRPCLPHDGADATSAIYTNAESGLVSTKGPTTGPSSSVGENLDLPGRCEFYFDSVFPEHTPQQTVFEDCALPLVDTLLGGVNACVFAFGCTGAGKTYSVLGPEGGRALARAGATASEGLLPRSVRELFRRLARQSAEVQGRSEYQVRASFVEVHLDKVFDLLGDHRRGSGFRCACTLRESGSGVIFAENAVEVLVRSVEELLAVVASGARARTTAATGVHAHSSRSHAILVLSIEHRWACVVKDEASCLEGGPPKYRSRTVRLTVVDLAGAETMEQAHGGNVDKAGVSTNRGLLVLGRVLKALASGDEHVPFRDSALTRLMQSSLAGEARTQMLTCVSGAAQDLPATVRVLRYAEEARQVELRPVVAQDQAVVEAYDPMAGDFPDAEAALNRRTLFLEAGEFGDVFARCCGDAARPLILYVHGSGPCNSSMLWNECCVEIERLMQNVEIDPTSHSGFFHVAIDCPGYGRSVPGDKQTIRSYPAEFLARVLAALKRKTAACVVGSSQGAAAVMNFAVERPECVGAIALCHPVVHAPLERFRKLGVLQKPVFAVFDTEDTGHPVSVGRVLRRYLAEEKTRYFEYQGSLESRCWEAKNMPKEIVRMLKTEGLCSGEKFGKAIRKLPDLTRVAGGFRSWNDQHGREWLPWYSRGKVGSGDSCVEEEAPGAASAGGEEVLFTTVLDSATGVVWYEDAQGARTKTRPQGPGVRVVGAGGIGGRAGLAGEQTRSAGRVSPKRVSLFSGTEEVHDENPDALVVELSDDDEDDAEEEEARKREQEELQRQREAEQGSCDLCRAELIPGSLRLGGCRCAICACCFERSLRYTRQCPACGDEVERVKGKLGRKAIKHAEESFRVVGFEEAPTQELLLQELARQRKTASRVVLEYGNFASRAGSSSKTAFTTFCRVVSVDDAVVQKANSLQLTKVEFNINPSYDRPTEVVTQPTGAAGAATFAAPVPRGSFGFAYAMGRAYPCVMTLHFAGGSGAGAAKLKLVLDEFWVQEPEAGFSSGEVFDFRRRVVLEFPHSVQLGRSSSSRAVVHDVCGPVAADGDDRPRNGWLRFGEGGKTRAGYF